MLSLPDIVPRRSAAPEDSRGKKKTKKGEKNGTIRKDVISSVIGSWRIFMLHWTVEASTFENLNWE